MSVQLEALDIIADMLLRFGPLLQSFHQTLLQALLPQLESHRQAVRKRTICALGNLVLSCNNALYTRLITHLHDGLELNKSNSQSRTYIQCVAAVW